MIGDSRNRAIGIGIGIGVAGALAIGLRYGLRRSPRQNIPDDISPAIFARRLSTTSRGDMVYHISGSGRPVVFLHGVYPGASSFEWSRVSPHFAIGHEVIAADLVGFGESERPPDALDASGYAESLADFLYEVCGSRQPVVVASGLTSTFALLMASRHPERLGELVLVAPETHVSRAPWARRGLALAARVRPLATFLYRTSFAREAFLTSWIASFGFADPSKADASIARNLAVCAQQPGARHAVLQDLCGGLAANLSGRLDRIPHPVTFVHAETPDGAPPPVCRQLSAGLSRAAFVQIPPSKALAALEVPVAVCAALGQVLGSGWPPAQEAA